MGPTQAMRRRPAHNVRQVKPLGETREALDETSQALGETSEAVGETSEAPR